MAKILNLDKIDLSTERKLVLGGVTYPVPPMTTENFIVTTRIAEGLVERKAGYADQIEATIEMITRCIPTLTAETLKNYSLASLGKIADFCRGESVEGEEEATAQQETKEATSGNAQPA